MDFRPKINLTGRVANNKLIVQHVSNQSYLLIVLYVVYNQRAILYPIIVFKGIKNFVQHVKQGDLLNVVTDLSSDYTTSGFNLTLVLNSWTFAQKITKWTREQTLHHKFPYTPSNYPTHSGNTITRRKHKELKRKTQTVKPKAVDIIPPQRKDNDYKRDHKQHQAKQNIIRIKPHIKNSKVKTHNSNKKDPSNWMDAMNKELGVNFDKIK